MVQSTAKIIKRNLKEGNGKQLKQKTNQFDTRKRLKKRKKKRA